MAQPFPTRRAASLGAVALGALATPLAAQTTTQTIDLGQIVVSANLVPTAASKVGAVVDVITGKEIAASGQTSVAQVLAAQPGITLRPTGGVGAQTGLSIWGAPQAYIKVLFDGIDVTDPSGTQTAYDFGQLATAGIGRIEVLKGAQSALYGGAAAGGVVSLFSARPTEEGVHQSVDVSAGTYNTQSASYVLKMKKGADDLAFTLNRFQTDGITDYVGAGSGQIRDGYTSTRATLTASHLFASGLRLGVAGFYQDSEGHYDAGGVPGTIPARTSGARVYAEFRTGAVKNTLSVSAYRMDRAYNSVWGDYRYVGTRQMLSYKGEARLSDQATLGFGADYGRTSFTNTDSYGGYSHDSRRKHSVFGELVYSPRSDLTLSGALRYDKVSGFTGAPSARLSMAWSLRPDLILRASAGTGFRTPSSYEVANAATGVSLDREKTGSANVGLEKTFADGSSLRATAFWFRVQDAIYSTTVYPPTYQQGGSATRKGIELSGKTKIGKVTLDAAYTYTDSSADATLTSTQWGVAKYLPAKNQLTLTVAAPLAQGLTGSLTVLAATERATMPDYAVLNAQMTYDMGHGTEAYLRVENLTDSDYQLVDGYAQPGRSLYVGLRKSF